MRKVLLVYGTSQGQSKRVGVEITEELRRLGIAADLVSSRDAGGLGSLAEYDGFILGGSVHLSRFQRSLVRWAKAHSRELGARPSAFYSVCLGVLQPDADVQRAERRVVEDFFRSTSWQPAEWRIFAGALAYTRLGFFAKRLLRMIAAKAGGGTDIRRDYEYTDWDEVRSFAQRFSARLN